MINGGCSDDGFEYFRGWLISMGGEVFKAALSDPDSLAQVTNGEEVECEDILYAAAAAYKAASGGLKLPRSARQYPELGDSWDFDDASEMTRRYPKLAAAQGL